MSNVFSTDVLIEDTVNKQTNIANRTQIIKNPNWWEADQLIIYITRSRGGTRSTPDGGRDLQISNLVP